MIKFNTDTKVLLTKRDIAQRFSISYCILNELLKDPKFPRIYIKPTRRHQIYNFNEQDVANYLLKRSKKKLKRKLD